jgi:hypothetical protein
LDSEIGERVEYIFSCFAENRQSSPIFTASLKDEVRKLKKIKEHNTRVFYAGPFDFILAMRKIFLWFVRLAQLNPFVFKQSVGINAQSIAWTQLLDHLKRMPDGSTPENFVAGDYANFDVSMVLPVLTEAWELIVFVGEALGASREHIGMMRCCAADLVYTYIDFFGDLIQVIGKNPSGHSLTVIINGIVNVLYMLICFAKSHPNYSEQLDGCGVETLMEEFFEKVQISVYGDDNVMNVHDSAQWFNHTAISNILASFGVAYTMADKEAESVPFITWVQLSFLKRTWVWDDDLMLYLCPLDMNSILKSLFVWIPSKVLSEKQQLVEILRNLNVEMFHHGFLIWTMWRRHIECWISDFHLDGVMDTVFPNYDELKAKFKDETLFECYDPTFRTFQTPVAGLEEQSGIQSTGDETEEPPPYSGKIFHCLCRQQCQYSEGSCYPLRVCALCGLCTALQPECENCFNRSICACGSPDLLGWFESQECFHVECERCGRETDVFNCRLIGQINILYQLLLRAVGASQ